MMVRGTVHDANMIPHRLLISKIGKITTNTYLRDRALIACLALGGFRVSEVVGIKNKEYIKKLREKLSKLKERIDNEKDPKTLKRLLKEKEDTIKLGKRVRKQIELNPHSYRIEPLKKFQCKRIVQVKDGVQYKFLQFEQVPVLKRREKVQTKKSPPLPYHKEKELIDFFWRYVKRVKNEEAILFPLSRRHCLRIVKKCLGDDYYNHYLRHHRITRLLGNDYNFTLEQAKTFIGSKKIESLGAYSHIGTGDIRDKMI